jgi:hypothetical protein
MPPALVADVHKYQREPREPQVEASMIRIKVEYDAYNRKFKLRDREFGSVFEDGVLYDLVVPIMTEGMMEEDDFVAPEAEFDYETAQY